MTLSKSPNLSGLQVPRLEKGEKMPRKKKKVADSPEVQNTEEDEKEPDAVVHVRKKRSFADAFIVISDSDGEEPKEENSLPRTKTRQQVERAKCSTKRKISQMTEEEQFALALQMSEQEARQANNQEEEEEELLRKAIAESLNSCRPSGSFDGPGTRQAHSPGVGDNPADSGPEWGRPTRPESPRSPAGSRESPADGGGSGSEVPRSPLVVLKRLSQDIVESSLAAGVVVSPGRDHPPAGCGDDPPSPTFGDSGPGLRTRLAPSPTFSRSAVSPWQLAPRKLFAGRRSGGEGTAERSPDPSRRLDSGPAPGGPEGRDRPGRLAPGVRKAEASRRRSRHLPGDPVDERSAEGCGDVRRSPGHPPAAGTAPTPLPRCRPGPADAAGPQQEDGGSVHYYWGVPFCPAGVDPDQYTRVILCQLEAYQKSLKLAQRQLLRKRAFGEPVVPGPPAQARGDRGREPQTAPEEAGDGDSENSGGAGAAPWRPQSGEPRESPTRDREEREGTPSEDEATTSHCQPSQGLFPGDPPKEGETRQITHSPTAWTPLTNARSPAAAPGSPPEEITVCPETQLSPPKACDLEGEEEAYSADREPAPQAGSPEEERQQQEEEDEEEAAWRLQVTCPLCDRGFPASTIQQHAMFCDGFLGKRESKPPPVLTRSRREPRGRSDGGRDAHPPPDIDKREKCYLCRSLVPFADYRRHVDDCLRTLQAGPPPDGPGKSRRPRSGKEGARKEGRLLSLLERSESNASDADGKLGSSEGGAFRPLSRTEEEDGGAAAGPSWEGCSRLSPLDLNDDDSPIKSFVSISEATDCLVDFKKQLSIRPGGRAQTRAGRGRRRKS
ncbi:BRCA1-A complex subunit RAP80 isoform X2 [Ornithorhynchus anatinus]|uniref:BRCA1-A complex subunit RAP80 isoform X2 n=1 Tax=Ornithorhynchus anatinus TaxID=9258 RepID=UPI0010A8CB5F|nr:BRCA1-A complex subunit RAP80 isoform X2 [Ornithorhynchus anatinus]